ncbi:3-oxoacyl-ACP reductase [Micromonospora parathelypteridis]|uniref:3-oxoacyl-[acyl-carrier protein] reductase n=1 Tax=Micromonospora parathelypteridis TaxID=1839617 RepID=A0A840VP37_9ACTN|nr:3-oxoacyl-ACP reductase [Micromonospora parathelypteridis]MBB5478467.1 3-oxoacyl-[acyl-carrier protein] reductase [Micromonospora parathelypteridis]GGO06093.1 3-oxoacyl-ACP reductase [Micromonospora parathelypteridis]
MTDRYASFVQSAAGRALVKRLGLPDPPRLRRHHPGDPLLPGPALLGAATGGRLAEPISKILTNAGIELADPAANTAAAGTPQRYGALLFDATGISDSTDLRQLYDFFHPQARSVLPSGRVIVLGTPPQECASPREAIAQRALEGLVRSIGKEFGRGTTAQLVYVTRAESGVLTSLESTLRFLLSGRSAYVSGQVIRVGAGAASAPADWDRPLEGQVVLVTGAARGIGAALAKVLARDGAQVVALDIPAAGDALAAVANDIGGTAVQLDLTAPDAPTRLADHLAGRHGRVDVVVHNAGITRDKTLGRMDADRWDQVIDVNLSSQERINDVLLERELIPTGGRIVSVSSIAGIAGNRGQTNYATSKAGVIGLVDSLAPALHGRGISVNAVAPGFIETRLTARIPLVVREAGRRMNSLAQGGLPVDVAETIGWLAWPASGAVSGNVIRVCGQSLLGA